MKKSLMTGALIAVIAISTFVAHKESMKLADMRADEIYSETLAQATRAIPRSTAQRVVNTQKEKEFLAGYVKQEFKGETFTETTIKGKLAVVYQDDFSEHGTPIVDENGEDIKKLYLSTPTEFYRLENLAHPVTEGLNGIEVELTGFLSSNRDESGEKKFIVNIQEDKIRGLESRSKKPAKDWGKIDERGGACGGNYCALVVLIDTTNNSPYFDLPTPQEMYDMVFVNPGRIKQNFYEQSYGQMTYGGTVTNAWLQLSTSEVAALMSGTNAQVEQYIINNNIDMNDYDQVIYVVQDPLYYGAISSIGPINQIINGQTYSLARTIVRMGWYFTPPTILAANGNITYWERQWIHETGHALGANHDNAAACEHGPTSLPSECIIVAYGNGYSTMGWSTLGSHFSFFKKREIGWITDSNIVSGQNGGNFVLKPIELANPQIIASSQSWNIPTQGTYYFEARKPIGFDSISSPQPRGTRFNFEGAFVYRELPEGFPVLTDVSPAASSAIATTSTDTSKRDVVLKNGEVLSSTGHGMEFAGVYNPVPPALATLAGPTVGVITSPITASCALQPFKLFHFYESSTNITKGQLPKQSWPQTPFVPDLSQVKNFATDNTNPNATIALNLDYRIFNDDSVACGATQIERSISLDGQLIEGPTLSPLEPWSFSNASNQLTVSGYNLSYGQHTITLVLTKQNDGSTITQDFLFNVIPI